MHQLAGSLLQLLQLLQERVRRFPCIITCVFYKWINLLGIIVYFFLMKGQVIAMTVGGGYGRFICGRTSGLLCCES